MLEPRRIRPRVPGPDAQFQEVPERLRELPIAEGPFRAVNPIEQPRARLGGLPLLDRAGRELVHVLPAHRDMKPIQHRVGLRRGRALHRMQARIAIGQGGDRRVWTDPMLAQGLRDRESMQKCGVLSQQQGWAKA